MEWLVVIAIVTVAAVVIGRRTYVQLRNLTRKPSGCGGGCSGCSAAQKSAVDVPASALARRR